MLYVNPYLVAFVESVFNVFLWSRHELHNGQVQIFCFVPHWPSHPVQHMKTGCKRSFLVPTHVTHFVLVYDLFMFKRSTYILFMFLSFIVIIEFIVINLFFPPSFSSNTSHSYSLPESLLSGTWYQFKAAIF